MDNLKPLSLALTWIFVHQSYTFNAAVTYVTSNHLKDPSWQDSLRSPNFSVSLLPNFLGFPTRALTFHMYAKHQPKMSQKLF